MADFTFKWISSKDMPVRLLELSFPITAKQDSDELKIPGRPKPLIHVKEQYDNISLKITLELKKGADFRAVFDWLSGSGRLITSDEPDKYYNAISVKGISSKRVNGSYRSITVQFTCEPFVYSTDPTVIDIGTSYTAIENPGTIYSEPVVTFTVQSDEAPIIMGDVNFDGKVDATDASLVDKEYMTVQTGGESILTDAQKAAADMNGDGAIDMLDSSEILRLYVNAQTGGSHAVTAEKQCEIDVNGAVMVIGLPAAVVRNGFSVTIDCENKLLYYTNGDGQKINILQYSYGDFPLLHTGENYAKYSGDISDVKIAVNERWR